MKKLIKKLFGKREVKTEPVKQESKKSLLQRFKEAEELSMFDEVWTKPLDRDAVIKSIFQVPVEKVKPVSVSRSEGKAQTSAIAMDADFMESASPMNLGIPDAVLRFYQNHSFIGWQACAIIRQNYLVDAACTIPANEAASTGYKISYLDNNDKADEKNKEVREQELAELKRIADLEYEIPEIFKQANINKKTFGISLCVPVMDDSVDMSLPFNIDGVKKGTYKGMSVIEPYWVAPQLDADAAGNPASRYFYEPTWWRVRGRLIHRSWCIKRCNSVVPDILKPTYYYGGVPLTQMLYERVYAAEKTANEAPLLAMTKRMLIVDADIDNMIENSTYVNKIMTAVRTMRDNFAMFVKRPGDEVTQIDTSLTDFDALVMNQYQLVACIAQMPATKLLKTTPKGFNATGEYEWEDYAQKLVEIQEHDFVPIIQRHFELYCKSELGKVIPLSVEFNPVDVPTEKEQAEVEAIEAQTDATYVGSMVMTPEELREILRSKENSRYSTLAEVKPESESIEAESERILAEKDAGSGKAEDKKTAAAKKKKS